MNHSPFANLFPGTMLRQYRLNRILADNFFTLTYLATDENLRQEVAIRELFSKECCDRAEDGQTVICGPRDTESWHAACRRFLEEGQILASVHHPNLMSMIDVFSENNTVYQVMPHHTLSDTSIWTQADHPKFSESTLQDFTLQMLDGLDALHQNDLLHLNIEPGNILLAAAGRIILTNPGNAHAFLRVLRTSRIIRTFIRMPYTPFEWHISKATLGPEFDIYGLGAVLYHLICKEFPSDATHRIDEPGQHSLAAQHRKWGYSVEFLSTIDKAMTFGARSRWHTAQEWKAALLDLQLSH